MRKNIFLVVLSIFSLLSCSTVGISENGIVKNEHYELNKSVNQKAVLVLFPCYPCDLENTKAEAGFLKNIEKEGITTLLLNSNQKLFLTESEKEEYARSLNKIFNKNKIKKENVFIGGFSSGGNVALLLSSYLIKSHDFIQPKGLLVVNSPIDLEQLYHNAERDIMANADSDAVEEGRFLTTLFKKELGKPSENLEKYKIASPYLMSCNSVENIQYLKDIKTRFYCEPDLEWQKSNRNRKFEDLNALMLKKGYEALMNLGNKNAEYIETKNRGIRANGKKHPHSWNLVEHGELVNWMTK